MQASGASSRRNRKLAALGALATLEPEIVKLDMSLVRDLDQHPTRRRVVAEGVETDAERRAIVDSGIDLIQGYLIAKPAKGFQPVTI